PVTEDYNQLIIEAGFGLGEAIVSGQVTPDSYVVEKEPRKILDINISTQDRGLYRASTGGNEWRDIPEPQASSQVLAESQILELSEIILTIERHYGFPCDVEWAFEAGKFYIVQSRPITTLKNTKTVDNNHTRLGPISDYTRLFQFPTLPYLLNNMLLRNYTHLKCVFLFKDNTWISYLPNKVISETLENGLAMFSDAKLFKKWNDEFEAYKEKAEKYFIDIVKQSELSKKDIEKFVELGCRCHYFYIKTEFFYTDKVYEESKKNPIIEKHVQCFENIKNNGRAFLNKMALEQDSYFMKVIFILSKQFDLSVTTLLQYEMQELIDLFEGKKVSQETLNGRLSAYICIADGEKSTTITGKIAEEAYNNFFASIDKNSIELNGVIANKGKVTGRVKMMFYGFNNFHSVSQLMNEMKEGDILVAETTSPEIMPACRKAGAILTNEGGLLSHAAIVSREMNIPCIVSLGNLDHILKDGDLVEVDAYNGIVRIIK
ncbi:MAG: hypothetical protein EXS50_01470, partial [Candidatus Taylorbacteria bacterium]|nr:hypothetical protein [Candidatus Taylorbacteria bacterium]